MTQHATLPRKKINIAKLATLSASEIRNSIISMQMTRINMSKSSIALTNSKIKFDDKSSNIRLKKSETRALTDLSVGFKEHAECD